MSSPKERIQRLLANLSHDATYEDILYGLHICRKIDVALKDVAAGRTVSRQDAEKRMAEWIDE